MTAGNPKERRRIHMNFGVYCVFECRVRGQDLDGFAGSRTAGASHTLLSGTRVEPEFWLIPKVTEYLILANALVDVINVTHGLDGATLLEAADGLCFMLGESRHANYFYSWTTHVRKFQSVKDAYATRINN